MFKPFYVHHTKGPQKMSNRYPRGFTLQVSPSENPRMVQVRGAFCSPKDQFSKKQGRSFAAVAEMREINKRKLPMLLASMCEACGQEYYEEQWYYVLKYVV